jgi:hypothetical protein
MFNYLATVTLEHRSGLVEDRVINTFSFETDAALISADADEIRDRLETFYSTTGEGAAHPISYYLGTALTRTIKPIVRLYNLGGHLDGTPAGSPVWIRTFANNLGLYGENSGLPAEVALCLSFHGDYGLDVEFAPGQRPRARDRGRVFLGPLTANTLAISSTGRVTPADTVRDAWLGAGKDLRDANDDKRWSVWSRAAARMTPVTLCSVDDAFDTQRRRGEKALARSVL